MTQRRPVVALDDLADGVALAAAGDAEQDLILQARDPGHRPASRSPEAGRRSAGRALRAGSRASPDCTSGSEMKRAGPEGPARM